MFALFWLTVLGLLTLYFGGVLDQRHNPNSNLIVISGADGRAEVVLQRNAYGHYVAAGAINGQRVEFLVDTGATHVGIPGALAQRLGLHEGVPASSYTAGGVVRTWLVKLDSVQLGAIERRHVMASVIPTMPGEDVLLGMSFLRDLEMVQRGDTLTLRP